MIFNNNGHFRFYAEIYIFIRLYMRFSYKIYHIKHKYNLSIYQVPTKTTYKITFQSELLYYCPPIIIDIYEMIDNTLCVLKAGHKSN